MAKNHEPHMKTSDTGLFAVAAIGGVVTSTMSVQMAADDEMGCPSCHEVHNATAFAPMLRTSNNASGLCLDCHNK